MLSNIQAEIDELKTDQLLNNDPQFHPTENLRIKDFTLQLKVDSILENTITD